jgi:CDP-diacylglycerol--glycerol-3-phosphate 3-phosphatidyltransferase
MAGLMDLKGGFQRALQPVADALADRGVTPNQVTCAVIAGSALVGAAMALWPGRTALALPAWLVARITLNTVDGMIARQRGLATPLGAVLNELGDALSDALLYLPLCLFPGVPAALMVSCVALGMLAETAGLAALAAGCARRYDGPLTKPDRAATFALVAGLLGAGVPPGRWLIAALAAASLLSVLTILRRVRRAVAAH